MKMKNCFILPRKLLQGLDTLVKKFPYEISREKELQQMELENELYLSEISYINDTSTDDINVESSEVTPLNSTLTEPLMNRSGTVHIEENTEMKILRPDI